MARLLLVLVLVLTGCRLMPVRVARRPPPLRDTLAAARSGPDNTARLAAALEAVHRLTPPRTPREARQRAAAVGLAAAAWPARAVTLHAAGREWHVAPSPLPGITLTPTDTLRIDGPLRHHRRAGNGAPVLCGPQPAPLALPGGLWSSRTAEIAFDNDRAFLTLTDPAEDPAAAADWTIAWAATWDRASTLDRRRIPDVFRPDRSPLGTRIHQLTPWDPDKRVVVFVHGFFDTPLMWRRIINGLFADPAVAASWQPWIFSWPSGSPLLPTAAALRQEIDRALAAVDPGGRSFAARHVTVVGHSMGGVLARTLVTDSGESLRRSLLAAPLPALPLGPDDRATLRTLTTLRPDPRVERIVCIFSPHRGSELAGSFIGAAVAALQRPHAVLAGPILRLRAALPRALRVPAPFLTASVPDFQPASPILAAIEHLPIAVEHHSIIADGFPLIPPAWNTDGVVSHRSAHLDTAASETTLRGWHLDHSHPAVIAALSRILLSPPHPPRS